MNDNPTLEEATDTPMKAGPKMFQAVAELVEKGLSPTRAAKALKLSPDTVSRWRREHPEFATMVDEAESRFIAEMTSCIAVAAKIDWRAAEAILARRFAAEFAKDGAAVAVALNLNTQPADAEDSGGALRRALQLPALRAHLQAMLERTTVMETATPQGTKEMALCESASPRGL